jgi:hypothetical protein
MKNLFTFKTLARIVINSGITFGVFELLTALSVIPVGLTVVQSYFIYFGLSIGVSLVTAGLRSFFFETLGFFLENLDRYAIARKYLVEKFEKTPSEQWEKKDLEMLRDLTAIKQQQEDFLMKHFSPEAV